VLSDPSDPLARGAVIGMLQRAGARRWMRSFAPSSRADSADDQFGLPVPATIQDVAGPQRRDSRRMIAYYAAAIAVMFLLFSSSSGGGSLLDEQDSSTLERLLNTGLGMTRVLAGKWLHLTLLGMLQVTVMFTWGMIAFRLDLLRHLPGFVIMTACAAAAAAAFGLVLATACRSRQQLSGFSYIIILSMSAVGGSMFPRFLMTPAMQKAGLFTFNAWALDGYLKVFWYEKPLVSLVPQVSVLIGLTAVFLLIARTLARRWETV
jgi:ABC-2 type transport system permease protein